MPFNLDAEERVPDPRYRGMNPKFVHQVWEKRKRQPEVVIPELGWLSPRRQPITPRDRVMMDIEDVANLYGYTLHDVIHGSARNKDISMAKNAAMWMLWFTRGHSFPVIGGYLGVHHSTAIYGIGRHMQRMGLEHAYVEYAERKRDKMLKHYQQHNQLSQAA